MLAKWQVVRVRWVETTSEIGVERSLTQATKFAMWLAHGLPASAKEGFPLRNFSCKSSEIWLPFICSTGLPTSLPRLTKNRPLSPSKRIPLSVSSRMIISTPLGKIHLI